MLPIYMTHARDVKMHVYIYTLSTVITLIIRMRGSLELQPLLFTLES